jgi:hypothetical protein
VRGQEFNFIYFENKKREEEAMRRGCFGGGGEVVRAACFLALRMVAWAHSAAVRPA